MEIAGKSRLELSDAINSALTPRVLDRVYAFARKRSTMLQHAGLNSDAEELLQAAVSSTIDGTCHWRHDKYELGIHLCGVISGRTAHMLTRTHRVRYYRFGLARDADGHDVTELHASDAVPTDDPEMVTERRDLADRVVEALIAMAEAGNDNQVGRILDTYKQGITERHDAAERTGLSLKKYDHARKRLMRMVAKLPDELRVAGSVNVNG